MLNAAETIEFKGCSLCQGDSSPTADKICGTDIHDWNSSEFLKITSVFPGCFEKHSKMV